MSDQVQEVRLTRSIRSMSNNVFPNIRPQGPKKLRASNVGQEILKNLHPIRILI
ncbi:hypothetical protein L484_011711 [Morus notabilis]|uniref:Uncharacterized protein n=1 Tax=Morus notabilis TaxID=981085 RepID=W9RRT4_9ROSA|nr:hypothetical protein L484_011711 [Morus notabilis]